MLRVVGGWQGECRAHVCRIDHKGACPASQVIYPALEAKVANVTRSYSVEHEDEVRGGRRLARCDGRRVALAGELAAA